MGITATSQGPRVSVLVVNYQSGPHLAECLRSLSAQTMAAFEAIVVDNGSADGSLAAARLAVAHDQRFRFDEAGANLGFAAGNNRAARQANAPWLALLNPDAFAAPEWLERLLDAAERHPHVTMFGSTQVDATAPDRLDGCGDNYFCAGVPWRGGFGAPLEALPPEGEVFSPCGAAALYRRDVFNAAGGFDESFFCYVEDVDLAFRLRLAGHRCIQVAEAVVRHVGGASSGGGSSPFARFHGTRNMVWCFVKNMPQPLLWPLLPLHVATMMLLWVRAVRRGLPGTPQALLAALRALPLGQRKKIQAARLVPWWVIARAMVWLPSTYARRAPVVRSSSADPRQVHRPTSHRPPG